MLTAQLVNLLYPSACLLCRARRPTPVRNELETHDTGTASVSPLVSHPMVCRACREALPRSTPPVCCRCGVALSGAFDAHMTCAACRKRPIAFDMARTPWQYAGAVPEAVQQFKYHRHWRLGRWMAGEMAQTAQASFPLEEITGVVAVPLHSVKRWVRGWNPAEELAKEIARHVQRPHVPGALRRRRWTATQTQLSWKQRARNVHRAFVASSRMSRHHTVLLIDDVLTSGATAEACSAALRNAGVQRVFVLAAARTPLS